jgi:hypothetical protein
LREGLPLDRQWRICRSRVRKVVPFLVRCEAVNMASSVGVSWQLDGITMEGTIVRPDGNGPFPAVVLPAAARLTGTGVRRCFPAVMAAGGSSRRRSPAPVSHLSAMTSGRPARMQWTTSRSSSGG